MISYTAVGLQSMLWRDDEGSTRDFAFVNVFVLVFDAIELPHSCNLWLAR